LPIHRGYHLLEGALNAFIQPEVPADLLFYVTDRCNARCGHCFYRYAVDAPRGSDLFDLEQITRIATSLHAPLHSVTLTGGEPFLRDDLADICDIFVRINQAEMITLTTNGWLTRRIIDQVDRICRLSKSRIYVQVSLDGLPELHDEIRGQAGSFQRVVATTNALKQLQKQYSHLDVALSTTISQINLHEMEALSDYVRDELNVAHSFEIVRGVRFREYTMLDMNIASNAGPVDPDSVPPNLNTYKEVCTRLEKIFRRNSYLVTGRHSLWTPMVYAYRVERFRHLLDVLDKRRPFRCPAGRSIGVIYPNGEVALCELSKPIGNLKESKFNFGAVWNSEQADIMRERIRRCYCSHGCFQSVAMMGEWRTYGRLLQSAFSYLLRPAR
jgi:MoaA/NifB/PqqE/SkfB family radical SAM enzyme